MSNPVERLTAEWQLAPAAALSDLPYTGMAIMRWTCRTALKREFVSQVGADVHVFSYVLRNSRATSWLDGRQVWDGVTPAHGLRILAARSGAALARAHCVRLDAIPCSRLSRRQGVPDDALYRRALGAIWTGCC
jgi:hypothetical protein